MATSTNADPFTIHGWEVCSRVSGIPVYCAECDDEMPHHIRWCKRHQRWALICIECDTHNGDVPADDSQGNIHTPTEGAR